MPAQGIEPLGEDPVTLGAADAAVSPGRVGRRPAGDAQELDALAGADLIGPLTEALSLARVHEDRVVERICRYAISRFTAAGWRALNITHDSIEAGKPEIPMDYVRAWYRLTRRAFPEQPVCVYGESAGGHMAMLLANEVPAPECVLSLEGPSDLTTGAVNDPAPDKFPDKQGWSPAFIWQPWATEVPEMRTSARPDACPRGQSLRPTDEPELDPQMTGCACGVDPSHVQRPAIRPAKDLTAEDPGGARWDRGPAARPVPEPGRCPAQLGLSAAKPGRRSRAPDAGPTRHHLQPLGIGARARCIPSHCQCFHPDARGRTRELEVAAEAVPAGGEATPRARAPGVRARRHRLRLSRRNETAGAAAVEARERPEGAVHVAVLEVPDGGRAVRHVDVEDEERGLAHVDDRSGDEAIRRLWARVGGVLDELHRQSDGRAQFDVARVTRNPEGRPRSGTAGEEVEAVSAGRPPSLRRASRAPAARALEERGLAVCRAQGHAADSRGKGDAHHLAARLDPAHETDVHVTRASADRGGPAKHGHGVLRLRLRSVAHASGYRQGKGKAR